MPSKKQKRENRNPPATPKRIEFNKQTKMIYVLSHQKKKKWAETSTPADLELLHTSIFAIVNLNKEKPCPDIKSRSSYMLWLHMVSKLSCLIS